MTRAIAFDLGGTHCSIGLVEDRSLLAVRDIALDATAGLARILPALRAHALELLAAHSLRPEECLGVSVSLPSLVDFASGRIVSTNNKYPDATTIDLRTWCKDSFGLPLAVENDARAALMGEHSCGAAEGASDALMLTLGTGIGAAVLVGGKPFRTGQAQGGNLGGHIPVSLHGRACTCGAIGCMEAEASSWALPLIVAGWNEVDASSLVKIPGVNFEAINFEILFQHARSGDAIAQAIAQHCIHVWSVGIVGLIHAYGPELIVMGGGIMRNAAEILPPLEAYVHAHAWTPSGRVRITPALLGNYAPLYGAIPLLEDLLPGAR